MKSPITTHVLDTATGTPAAGLALKLEALEGDTFVERAAGTTNDDGRVAELLAPGSLTTGVYRMRFETGAYHAAQGVKGFYPYAEIVFEVTDTSTHHHIPLLLSPFGYSTYRGS